MISSEWRIGQKIKINDFNFSDKLENGVRLQSYEGWLVFEKAELPMKLACTLPALDRFPPLQIYECTACRFARPVNLESNLFDLRPRKAR